MYLKGILQNKPSKWSTKQETSTPYAVVLSGKKWVLQLLCSCLYVQFYTVVFGPLSENTRLYFHILLVRLFRRTTASKLFTGILDSWNPRIPHQDVQFNQEAGIVPLQARCGPEGSRRFGLPDFHDIRHMKVVRSSASRTGRLYPQECSWYSFSLGAESTPGPWYGWKELCHWKIQWHHRESMPGPSD